MRWMAILLGSIGLVLAAHAEPRVSIAQLEQFLLSKQAQREADTEIAERLSSVTLGEQLTAPTLARLRSETKLGPRTSQQLELLALASIFTAPPATELPATPAPDPSAKKRMINAAREYVNGTLQHLPDFLATRVTLCFEKIPQGDGGGHSPAEPILHFARQYRRQIAYRDGREVDAAVVTGAKASQDPDPSGLTTWGEFGSMLAIVLSDSFKGSVEWSRWQRSETGAQVAVFQYTVPKAASHFQIDLCCYQRAEEHPEGQFYRDTPSYHGEIDLDPMTGAVDRITLEPELDEDGPLAASGMAVQYGHVEISGKDYICPIRSVALSEFRSPALEANDNEIGTARYLNVVRFVDYHKFASTARVIAVDPDAVPQQPASQSDDSLAPETETTSGAQSPRSPH